MYISGAFMSNLGRPINYAAREAKVEAILDGAVQCFVKKGFHGSSMTEIARASQVSQASLYQYFTSKNELILEIAKRYSTSDLVALRRIESASDFLDALERELYLTGDKVETIMYLEILAESSRNEEIKQAVQSSFKELFIASCEMIKKIQVDSGATYLFTPEEIAHYLFAYVDGLSCQIATEDVEYSPERLRQLVKVLLKPSN
jgi:AcrR family transcriptional regulator